jgi:hypothetical protein
MNFALRLLLAETWVTSGPDGSVDHNGEAGGSWSTPQAVAPAV